ncbi:hypothetical protein J7297_00574 [Nakaseomyces glabratus]|nr:hypothetical protein J7297_00574 [Nakaseomyces glabratus]
MKAIPLAYYLAAVMTLAAAQYTNSSAKLEAPTIQTENTILQTLGIELTSIVAGTERPFPSITSEGKPSLTESNTIDLPHIPIANSSQGEMSDSTSSTTTITLTTTVTHSWRSSKVSETTILYTTSLAPEESLIIDTSVPDTHFNEEYDDIELIQLADENHTIVTPTSTRIASSQPNIREAYITTVDITTKDLQGNLVPSRTSYLISYTTETRGNIVTVYTTWCPIETTTTPPPSLSVSASSTLILSTVTTTTRGVITIYTTWCPYTDTKSITTSSKTTTASTSSPSSVLSTVTTTTNGKTTVYTTWCPPTSNLPSSSLPTTTKKITTVFTSKVCLLCSTTTTTSQKSSTVSISSSTHTPTTSISSVTSSKSSSSKSSISSSSSSRPSTVTTPIICSTCHRNSVSSSTISSSSTSIRPQISSSHTSSHSNSRSSSHSSTPTTTIRSTSTQTISICHSCLIPTTTTYFSLSTVTTTTQGIVTIYTTYCPITSTMITWNTSITTVPPAIEHTQSTVHNSSYSSSIESRNIPSTALTPTLPTVVATTLTTTPAQSNEPPLSTIPSLTMSSGTTSPYPSPASMPQPPTVATTPVILQPLFSAITTTIQPSSSLKAVEACATCTPIPSQDSTSYTTVTSRVTSYLPSHTMPQYTAAANTLTHSRLLLAVLLVLL